MARRGTILGSARGKILALVLAAGGIAGPSAAGQTLLFTTEPYPPFGMVDDNGYLHGVSVDQVRKIMEASGIAYRIELMPWARAIALAETQPSTCVFSAAQTAERSAQFNWIMPLAESKTLLVRHRQSSAAAETVQQAKAYTIGTHRSDFTETLLRTMQFPRIEVSASFEASLAKLLGNRIDLMPMADTVYAQLRRNGLEIESVVQLSEQRLGIACNRAVPLKTINLLRKNLARIIADGIQADIYRAYDMQPPR